MPIKICPGCEGCRHLGCPSQMRPCSTCHRLWATGESDNHQKPPPPAPVPATVTRYVLFTKHSDTARWLLCTIMLSQERGERDFDELRQKKHATADRLAYPHVALCKVELPETGDMQKKCDWMGLAKNGTCRKLPGRILMEI